MTALDRAPESRQRAEAYWFLSTLFAEPPSAEQLARMVALAEQGQGEQAGIGGAILAALGTEMDIAALAQRLAIEHTRLFLGIREGYGPPPPYESLWREGQMMGETTIAVLTAYAEAGFQPDGRWGPPDHLVEQLRFIATLANGEGDAWGSGQDDDAVWARERQAAFMTRHLHAWMPAYCQALEAQATEPLYQALARVAAEIVADDARYLGLA
jgi:TorA maturation chaperone TorD